MAIYYEWHDDDHIIMNVFIEQPWTWAEYQTLMETLMPTLRDAGHPCATVVDCSQVGQLPRDGNFLTILMNAEKTMPDNVFASAVVAAPYAVGVFMNMLMRIRPRASRLALFTPTMEEAYEKIYARYRELQADLQKGQ